MYEYPENDWRNYLAHSAKGSHWKKGHKYVAIKNGKYIYPEDLKKSPQISLDTSSSGNASGVPTRTGGGSSGKLLFQPEHEDQFEHKKKHTTTIYDTKKREEGTSITYPGRPRGRNPVYKFKDEQKTPVSGKKNWYVQNDNTGLATNLMKVGVGKFKHKHVNLGGKLGNTNLSTRPRAEGKKKKKPYNPGVHSAS